MLDGVSVGRFGGRQGFLGHAGGAGVELAGYVDASSHVWEPTIEKMLAMSTVKGYRTHGADTFEIEWQVASETSGQ